MRILAKLAPFLVLGFVVIGLFLIEVKNGVINFKTQKPQAVSVIRPSDIPATATPNLETPTPQPTFTPLSTAIATIVPTIKPTQAPVSGPPGSGLSTINVATEKGNFTATVLSLDLGSTRVITDTGNDSDCQTSCNVFNLQTYVSRNGGFAGVNGTYFCPITYPDCSAKTNSYDFSVYNTRLNHWINHGMLSWNSRAMVYFDGGGAHYLQNANSFSGGLNAGLTNFPGLIDNGNVQIDDNQSGLDPKQVAVGTKVGIGVRGTNNIMVVVALNVNMQQFAYVFKSLGASGALNLDTGGSTALYYGGHYVYGPGRDIPNAIIFASK
jgi:hypothetical protein